MLGASNVRAAVVAVAMIMGGCCANVLIGELIVR
jgi:hypothetical protein